MNTKARKTTLAESVVLSLAQAADEDAVIDQWGLSVAEIEADLTPEQLAQSQDWLDSLVAGARLKFTEDDVTYYYENGKYYSVYGDDAAYDGTNNIGEPEEVSPEMMAVILLGIHLDAGTLHVVGENNQHLEATAKWHVLDDEKGGYSRGPIGNGADYGQFNGVFAYADDGSVIGLGLTDDDKIQFTFYKDGKYNYGTNINSILLLAAKSGSAVSSNDRREITKIAQDHQSIVEESRVRVADLGVDVDPDRYYVVTGSNSMWGGANNSFASEAEAKAWVDTYNQHADGGLKIVLGDDDAVIKGSQLIAAYQTESSMTEREMLDALVALVKEKGLRVASPDYTKSNSYSAQWKAIGANYYYQLPGNGPIVAIANKATGNYQFNADGLTKPTLESFGLLGEAKSGEEIALRNKNRNGQGILDAEGNEIPKSVVFSGGYGGAYNYGGRLSIYQINAITGEMTQIEVGEDALQYFSQLA